MIHGGVLLTRGAPWRGTRHPTQAKESHAAATWRPYPATMHGGVQCICPAMHGGGAKWPIFVKTFKSVSNLKFVLNLGYK